MGSEAILFSDSGNVAVGTVDAEAVADGLSMSKFGDAVVRCAEDRPKINLMLNFELVEAVSSKVFSELVRIRQAVREMGGIVRVCGVIPSIFELFVLTKLDQVFDVRADETMTAAVDRFNSDVAET